MRVGDYVQAMSDIDLGYERVHKGRRGDVVRLLDGGKAMVKWFGDEMFTEVFPFEVSILMKGE